jgi:PAT family beta-lactamase induction signal transducer AmpG
MRRWLESLAVYRDRRMLAILGLGFSSGLPYLLVFRTLSVWLEHAGLSIQAIGLFAAVHLPYSFKFLWAPFVDRLPIPVLTAALGRRRSWLLVTQLGLAAAIVTLGYSDPAATPLHTAVLALVVAAFSSSQDIVIDAYRIDRLSGTEQGAGAAMGVIGYRLGMLASGAGVLFLVDHRVSWQAAYLLMAGLVGVGMITTLLCREPESVGRPDADDAGHIAARTRWQSIWTFVVRHLRQGVLVPLGELAQQRGFVLLLLFVLLFKLGDALASALSNVFLVQIGFTLSEVAGIAKTYGLAATLLGVFLGGWLVRAQGMARALWIGGLVQMGSNLMYALQAHVGADPWLLLATIGIEYVSVGVGDAAFVAYLSSLCNRAYSATQYALLSALAGALRHTLSMFTGFLTAALGWEGFFVVTTAAAVPGLVVLYLLVRSGGAGLSPRSTA